MHSLRNADRYYFITAHVFLFICLCKSKTKVNTKQHAEISKERCLLTRNFLSLCRLGLLPYEIHFGTPKTSWLICYTVYVRLSGPKTKNSHKRVRIETSEHGSAQSKRAMSLPPPVVLFSYFVIYMSIRGCFIFR